MGFLANDRLSVIIVEQYNRLGKNSIHRPTSLNTKFYFTYYCSSGLFFFFTIKAFLAYKMDFVA